MNARQKRTLAEIFAGPVSGTIRWSAIESLLKAIGCRVIEGRGSRAKFEISRYAAAWTSSWPMSASLPPSQAASNRRQRVSGPRGLITGVVPK